MKTGRGILFSVSLFVITMPLFGAGLDRQTAAFQPVTPSARLGCAAVFKELTKDENWMEHLINPVIAGEQELAERIELYRQVSDCTEGGEQSLPAEIRDNLDVVRQLLAYFLIFADGAGTPENETELVLTTFAQSDNPAIVKIRDEAGIPPPEGYVFVRFYASRPAMPFLVRQVFSKPGVAGVTFFTRYVAVLREEHEDLSKQVLELKTLPATVSHELAHAYINSALGLKHISMPKWYHEGLAIYFSGSAQGYFVHVDPNLVISTIPPEDYQQYKTNFDYLEKQHGREKFLNLIKQSVEQADPAVLYRDLGISGEMVLAARAGAWRQGGYLIWVIIAVAGAIILFLFPVSKRKTGTVKPVIEVQKRCPHCGYTGPKRAFYAGYCPNCEQRIDDRKPESSFQ